MFVDTNVLIYSTRSTSSFHARAVALWQLPRVPKRNRHQSQVIWEYLSVVTRPSGDSEPLPMVDALADVERFVAAFDVLEDGPEVGALLGDLCRSVAIGGRQVHDANIVATMLAHGESRLLTANRSDFRRFEPRIELVGI